MNCPLKQWCVPFWENVQTNCSQHPKLCSCLSPILHLPHLVGRSCGSVSTFGSFIMFFQICCGIWWQMTLKQVSSSCAENITKYENGYALKTSPNMKTVRKNQHVQLMTCQNMRGYLPVYQPEAFRNDEYRTEMNRIYRDGFKIWHPEIPWPTIMLHILTAIHWVYIPRFGTKPCFGTNPSINQVDTPKPAICPGDRWGTQVPKLPWRYLPYARSM